MNRSRYGPFALAIALAAATCLPGGAQQGKKRPAKTGVEFGFHNTRLRLIRPVWLLAEESVQADLKLSGEQVKGLPALRLAIYKKQGAWDRVPDTDEEAWRLAIREIGDMVDEELRRVLSAAQLKRLKQISLQVHEGRYLGLVGVLRHPDTAKEFGLTQKQLETLADMREGIGDSERKVRNKSGNADILRAHMELVRQNDRKIEEMLTAKQKTKLKALVGPEFKGKIESLRR